MANIHVVHIKLVKIGPMGSIIDDEQAISARVQFSVEHRVIPDATIPNSANYPSLATYLRLEAENNYLPVHIDQYTIVTAISDLAKIDSVPVDGILGVEDSLSYKVAEIERHLHNDEKWYGRGGGNLAELNNLTTWTVTAGNPASTFGTEVQLSDGNQFTDIRYDPHRLFITAVSANNATYLIELRSGETFAESAIMTTIPYRVSNQSINIPVGAIGRRCLSANGLWARAMSQTAGATIQFLLGIHTYQG